MSPVPDAVLPQEVDRVTHQDYVFIRQSTFLAMLCALKASDLYFKDVDGCGGHGVSWPAKDVESALALAEGMLL